MTFVIRGNLSARVELQYRQHPSKQRFAEAGRVLQAQIQPGANRVLRTENRELMC